MCAIVRVVSVVLEVALQCAALSLTFHVAAVSELATVRSGNIALDPKMAYIVVPHTLTPKLENTFLLRVFSEAEVRFFVKPCRCRCRCRTCGCCDQTMLLFPRLNS